MSNDRPHEDVPADPEGMRELARALKADARDLNDVATGARSAVGSMEFEGPAADRFQHKLRSEIKTLRALAERLTDVARLLLDAADEVERERRRRAEASGTIGLVSEETALWIGR